MRGRQLPPELKAAPTRPPAAAPAYVTPMLATVTSAMASRSRADRRPRGLRRRAAPEPLRRGRTAWRAPRRHRPDSRAWRRAQVRADQPADLRPLHRVQRDDPLDLGDLAVEKRDLPQPPRRRSRAPRPAARGRAATPVPCGRTGRRPCASRIRAISHALPVTSNATRSSGARLWANSCRASRVLGTRPRARPPAGSMIATWQKSR